MVYDFLVYFLILDNKKSVKLNCFPPLVVFTVTMSAKISQVHAIREQKTYSFADNYKSVNFLNGKE